jgi:hypothetical protein
METDEGGAIKRAEAAEAERDEAIARAKAAEAEAHRLLGIVIQREGQLSRSNEYLKRFAEMVIEPGDDMAARGQALTEWAARVQLRIPD